MNLLTLLFAIFSLFVYNTQSGPLESRKYCRRNSDCLQDQMCLSKQCVCMDRFVAVEFVCYPEAANNQECLFDDQCVEPNQVCENSAEKNKRCICDRYHEYDFESKYCTPLVNLTDMLVQKRRLEETLAARASSTFRGIYSAGASVACVGLVGLTAAFFYCFRMHSSDRKLDERVDALAAKVGSEGGKSGAPPRRDPAEEERERQTAAVVPIVQDNMVLG